MSMFKVGDKVVIESYRNTYISCGRLSQYSIGDLMVIRNLEGNVISDDDYNFIDYRDVRHATDEEITVGHRIESSNSQAISDCSLSNLCQNDTQNSLSIKQENQDMGDDSHIENSPLCKVG